MNDSRYIIIKPLIGEKATRFIETERKYFFQVAKRANKIDVKRAVQEKFNVEVSKVGIMNYKGKKKNTSVRSDGKVLRTSGYRSSWKKAVVTLKEGFVIDLMSGGGE
tara:strand:+ start:413 stop:733 length:321 start_codon:yes stop_codon:yes gene_type:complete